MLGLTIIVTLLLFVYLLAALLRPEWFCPTRSWSACPMWLLPILIVVLATVLALPLGLYMTRVLDRGGAGNRAERLMDTGPQNWKQYCFAMLAFNAVVFVIGFAFLSLQAVL